ncbi:hypothetical protein Leryth_017714 [Lithospermum erythrorhizon]|uniref:Phytocyanin domain-containing protein n=1 Tax=Lithospermum erythrorhizon TaxID=34254 RepID=A0AAV3QGF6_LITER|nr:hypothetical protein Leryth_017714 [Lithospermum erythrorhizon]
MAASFLGLMFGIFLLFSFSEAREFFLNGKHNSWTIPSSPDQFTKWAQKLRFQIGDSLVVEYDPKSDSVLEVNEQDYKNCDKSNPIKSYQDAKTSIDLDRSGWFYFISGADGHCEKGQKFTIEVLNAKHASKTPPQSQLSPSPSSSPSPSPSSSDEMEPPEASAPAAKATSGGLGLRTSAGTFMAGLSWFMAMAI